MKRLKWLIYLLSFFMTINFTTPVFASFCQLEHGLLLYSGTKLIIRADVARFWRKQNQSQRPK